MNRAVNQHWALTSGYHNGRLARLDKWLIDDNTVTLFLRPTEYKILLYSNRHISDIKRRWGERFLSKALGISAVVITQDEKILLMQRSANVGEYDGCYDVFGGHIECFLNRKSPDVFLAMEKELEEELAIPAPMVKIEGFGLIEACEHQKPELLFAAYAGLDHEAILSTAKAAPDRFEYNHIFVIENKFDDIHHFLRNNIHQTSPSAYGCLSVYKMQLMKGQES
ncbi:NUDIX domain-containing protein [candidate division KSB1 bacterium]|nr:NUDIX domain-containing protein [candidate division KSB1 bacterium]